MIFKKLCFMCFLLMAGLFGISGLFGQEEAVSASEENQERYVIKTIDFDVKGRSRRFALMYHGGFQIGEVIKGKAGLETYIKEKTQNLLNQRVLASVEIESSAGEDSEDGLIPVALAVKVVDTWNLIALPYPKFDSNSGFEISIKARDYNFLGTLVPLKLDLGYEHRDGEGQTTPVKDIFKLELDSDIPFSAFGLNWNIDFDHAFSYSLIDENGTFTYKNTTGLSVEFPIKRTVLTTGFAQYFILHEENPERYEKEYGNYADFYMATKLYASWRIPLGIPVYTFGELTYTPEMAIDVNYRPSGDLEFWRKGPNINFSHSLGFGKMNWIGNFRNGFEASVHNSNTYNFYSHSVSNDYGISLKAHKIVTEWFGISGYFQMRQWFFYDPVSVNEGYPPYTQVGDTMRGVLDKYLKVYNMDYMISLNLDLTFRAFQFLPSVWFNNRIFRFFDFDLHVVPFVDAALLQGRIPIWGDKIPMPRGFIFSGGLEFVVFPGFMRSLYLRASFGYNLNKFLETFNIPKWDELFIGIGHHY